MSPVFSFLFGLLGLGLLVSRSGSNDNDKPAETDSAPVDVEQPADNDTPSDTDQPSDNDAPADVEQPNNDTPSEEPPADNDAPSDVEQPTGNDTPSDNEQPSNDNSTGDNEAPADETPPENDTPPTSGVGNESSAPDLPDSAYALKWEGLTDQEQYMLELVNRARMNPEAEVQRTGEAVDSGVSTAPKQALAVDPILSAAADNHSGDMLERDFFDHTNPDKDGPTDRAQAEGWTGRGVWENISARWTSASSVSDEQSWVDASHEGLWESDGHQRGMLQDSHTVTGIGIDWGPWEYPGSSYPTAMLATEKFANDGKTYLTGVVIDDADGDNFYDIGEGQGGVRVTVWNDQNTYATSTWGSGGYSVAVAPGTYNVRFEGGDLKAPYETSVTVGNQNEKLDVNEDNIGTGTVALSNTPEGIDADDPIASLFLSAEASKEVLEREASAAASMDDDEPADALAML